MIIYLIKLIIYRFFTKINDEYITFTSFNGKFADSPKALTEYIHKKDENKTIIWLVNDIDNNEIPDFVKKIKYNSFKGWIYYSKSKIIIDNVFCMHEYYQIGNSFSSRIKYKIISFLKNKKGQRFYTTWHGTPIKRILSDSINTDIKKFSCPNTTMFLDNKYAYDILNRVTFGKISIKYMGAPKNDLLLNNNISIDNLRNKLKLPLDKKILLFAPTFRTDSNNKNNINRSGIDQINIMDINELLNAFKEKFDDEWCLVCRFHYYVEKNIDWNVLKEKYGNNIINGNEHEDITEYLKCSDALLTDMSSCIFDFALTEKPAFIFFPDIENFKNKERGLYLDINDLPFKCATTFSNLLINVQSFSNKDYIERVNDFLSKMEYIRDKNASEKIAEYILKDGESFE